MVINSKASTPIEIFRCHFTTTRTNRIEIIAEICRKLFRRQRRLIIGKRENNILPQERLPIVIYELVKPVALDFAIVYALKPMEPFAPIFRNVSMRYVNLDDHSYNLLCRFQLHESRHTIIQSRILDMYTKNKAREKDFATKIGFEYTLETSSSNGKPVSISLMHALMSVRIVSPTDSCKRLSHCSTDFCNEMGRCNCIHSPSSLKT